MINVRLTKNILDQLNSNFLVKTINSSSIVSPKKKIYVTQIIINILFQVQKYKLDLFLKYVESLCYGRTVMSITKLVKYWKCVINLWEGVHYERKLLLERLSQCLCRKLTSETLHVIISNSFFFTYELNSKTFEVLNIGK